MKSILPPESMQLRSVIAFGMSRLNMAHAIVARDRNPPFSAHHESEVRYEPAIVGATMTPTIDPQYVGI
jgi:hypothetical protein